MLQISQQACKYKGITRARLGGCWEGAVSTSSALERLTFTVQPDKSPLQAVAARAHDLLVEREENFTDALWNEVSI